MQLSDDELFGSIAGPGCVLDNFTDLLQGCKCEGDCRQSDKCSCQQFGGNYNPESQSLTFELDSDRPLMECGSDCACSSSNTTMCGNRVIQKGPSKALEVFSTPGKGLGVRSTVPIEAKSFVCEYIGEVIGSDERARRLSVQSELEHQYIYTVTEHVVQGEPLATIFDARHVQAVGRYINHSCVPNLTVIIARLNTPLPHIAFFANRHIPAGEELSYSYVASSKSNDTDRSGVRLGAASANLKRCLCGAESCTGFMPRVT